MAKVRVAVPTDKGGLDDVVYERLGRTPTFTIVEIDTKTGEITQVEVIENPGYRAGSGAGVKAVQTLGEHRVNIYTGPTPGPNAYAALEYLGIKVVPGTPGMKVSDAVKKAIKQT